MTDATEENHAIANARGWLASILEMVAALDAVGNDDEACDTAASAIRESVLSVRVRDGWRAPGEASDDGPEEYEILLSTGGPALRIFGDLDDNDEPDDFPKLQWQDWGTPWTDYPLGAEREAVQKFAACFYFGEG
jgi:hypothetical protein